MQLSQIAPEWRQLLSPLCLAESLDSKWETTRHHLIIDHEFRMLWEPGNDTDILVISAPPRSGKSSYLSHWAPAHWLCRNPYKTVMLCSYGARLASWLSRRVRDRVHQCAPLFGLKGVNPLVSRADEWEIDGTGGGMLSAGVDGSITGRGAHLILIDDYMRKGKDAASATVRDNQWEWLQSTLSTRREPGGKIVILATPWHSSDLIGRLMRERDEMGLNVRRIVLQAIYEDTSVPDPLGRQPGEALWPSRWPLETMQKQKALMGPYWWRSQYLGLPGQYGANEWPERYFSNIWAQDDEWPSEAQSRISAVALDPSKGRGDTSDFQALVNVIYHDGLFWLDFDIDRRPVPELMRHMASWCKARKPAIVGIEGNAFQELLAPDYLTACAAINYHQTMPELMVNSVQKELRIMRLGAFFDQRKFRIRRNSGGHEFLRQAREFPNGDHDDGLDGAEMALRLLNYLVTGVWAEETSAGEILVA